VEIVIFARDYSNQCVRAAESKDRFRIISYLEVVVTSKLIPCIVITILMLGIMSTAQQDDMLSTVVQQPIPPMSRPNPEEEARRKMERDMAKKANEERHAALKRDTDKLLRLSTELKEFVDKSNENTLSLDVIKKAEEIEKLAHSVREKMKGK